MTKLRTLRKGDHPRFSGWTQYNHRGPYGGNKDTGELAKERSDRRGSWRDAVTGFEDGGRRLKPRDVGGL